MKSPKRNGRRGGSALELALFLPWFVFLFIGAFDWGFYSHALISTESAARVAALYASTDAAHITDTKVCTYALNELKITPNVGAGTTTCNALPVIVTSTAVSGASSPDGQAAAQVAVTYQTVSLIPIPGILEKQAIFYRVIQMRLRG